MVDGSCQKTSWDLPSGHPRQTREVGHRGRYLIRLDCEVNGILQATQTSCPAAATLYSCSSCGPISALDQTQHILKAGRLNPLSLSASCGRQKGLARATAFPQSAENFSKKNFAVKQV